MMIIKILTKNVETPTTNVVLPTNRITNFVPNIMEIGDDAL